MSVTLAYSSRPLKMSSSVSSLGLTAGNDLFSKSHKIVFQISKVLKMLVDNDSFV